MEGRDCFMFENTIYSKEFIIMMKMKSYMKINPCIVY